MIDIRTNRRLCNAFIWFTAACALVILMTSCSPYEVQFHDGTAPTAAPSMTATADLLKNLQEVTPAPYWQLAAQGWEHIAAVIDGGKIGH
jgi:hypothetical protein